MNKETKKILVSFHWDCGRNGAVDGLFVTTPEELESLPGKHVYFGEILGKHSEIFGKLESEEFTIKSDDQEFIKKLVELFGSYRISGYNPIDYIEGA